MNERVAFRVVKWPIPYKLPNNVRLRKESKSSSLLAIQNKNFYNFARNMPKSSIKRSIESAILPNF